MTDMRERYAAAEKLLPWNLKDLALNTAPTFHWISDRLFYYGKEVRRDGKVISEFKLVDAESGKECELFDRRDLERLLGKELSVKDGEWHHGKFRFVQDGKKYCYLTQEKELLVEGEAKEEAVSVSPDGRKTIYVRDYDLYLKEGEEEYRLTFDGEEFNDYAGRGQASDYISAQRFGLVWKPGILWSPDSRHFLTYRIDQRKTKDLYLLESYDQEGSSSIRPRLHTYKCAFPEDKDDEVPQAYFYMGDAEAKTVTEVGCPPQSVEGGLFNARWCFAKWLEDSSAVYTTIISRAYKSAAFTVIETDGSWKTLYTEEDEEFLNMRTFQFDGYGSYNLSNFLTEDRKTLIFQSEREDLTRFFRYDVETGECLGGITPEGISAGRIVAVEGEWIYFYGFNMPETSDPCYERLCRVRMDGTEFSVLTPEDAMHHSSVKNGYILDTYSRVDLIPKSVLRKADGTFVKEIVEADVSALLEAGYIIPERFSVKSEEGYDLYGILVKPAGFDPEKSYPLIDYIYGGMQCYNVPKTFQAAGKIAGREIMGGLEEFAQLGFAGIILDGKGTPGRGRKFHHYAYENIHGCAGLADHAYTLPQLKEKYPFIDLERVGIWGNSGGGCATSRALLEYPDVYKVGVSSAGNHDQRMYSNIWTENYYGLYKEEIYKLGDNTALAKNLKGKLFIVHGAMDDNVAMSQSIRLIDALIREDKDFDFLILPRCNHNVPADPYFIRKKLDYFVRYLLEEEVPEVHFRT